MPDAAQTVYLVDGTSYIHRAYHALRNLSSSNGFPTNAVLGFTKMILKLLEQKSPRYMAVVLDAKGPTFRHTLYEPYKANRPPMPEDMAVQIPVMKEIVAALNLCLLEKEGYEADDIIGTLARLAEERGHRVIMVTGDKDFRQLLSERVSMWDPMRDVVVDRDFLLSAHGLEPARFVDVMGLAGDSTDNIPGVPGVGEKTALELIRTFGSLEAVFENLDAVKRKKLKSNLEASREVAALSKKLVTIDCRVPLTVELEDLRVGEPDRERLAALFRDLEFKGLWESFAARPKETGRYSLCMLRDDLEALARRIQEKGFVSLDTETTSQDPLNADLVGISFSLEPGTGVYLPLAHRYVGAPPQLPWEEAREVLKPILEDKTIRKIGQNIKYDAEVLARHGIRLGGIHFDTMVASYVINPSLRQHGLDFLAQHYFNHKMIGYAEVTAKGGGRFEVVPVDRARDYSCEDADIALRLKQVLEQQLREDQNLDLFYDLEMKLLPVLMDMEMTGIKVDVSIFQDMARHLQGRLREMEQAIYAEAGMHFNINSPQQLGEVLFEKLKLPAQRKTAKTGRYSTDMRVLKKLAAYPHRIPKLVLQYRTLVKLKSTYLDALIKLVHKETGRLHTSFNQTVTATGRLSSSNPNLQNIPVRSPEGREIRKGFVAEEGHRLLSADYSQIELRIFAHYSGDEAFAEAFQQDEDIHARTAAEIMGVAPDAVTPEMRRIAKAINFGIIYGMGPQKLAEELEIDAKTARSYIETYYARYPGVTRYREAMVARAREQRYVTTLFNRRRYLPDILHKNRVIRAEAERMAVNTPVQGTAADLIKKAMIRIHDRLQREGFEARMLLQVHDELLFEVPEGELERLKPMIREEMEGVYPLAVPLKVDIGVGRNWAEAH